MYTFEQLVLAAIWGMLVTVTFGLVVWRQVEVLLWPWERSLGRSKGRAEVIEAVDRYVRGDYSACELCQQVPELWELWWQPAGSGDVLADAEQIAAAAWGET